ncbi:hypothetical protein NIES23_28610 [Trichormus variabilis NIES-23]|uniref:Uncharacterized protein n=1 Tax=Trichormus variabilis NIES-23 TaxID=1973479 RepID=A0A1Z4KM45_ANAVA|nr:hypothetical protein NIES23_28610 [Trichormus variabilis NIES-23]
MTQIGAMYLLDNSLRKSSFFKSMQIGTAYLLDSSFHIGL